jgi:hypothetical protein
MRSLTFKINEVIVFQCWVFARISNQNILQSYNSFGKKREAFSNCLISTSVSRDVRQSCDEVLRETEL